MENRYLRPRNEILCIEIVIGIAAFLDILHIYIGAKSSIGNCDTQIFPSRLKINYVIE